ncbi:MAG: AAA family ATPase [Puniceicoccales bacterium]
MSDTHLFEKCRAYVTSSANRDPLTRDHLPRPAITLSRQVGARGTTIGNVLVERLNAQFPDQELPWTLFHKALIQRVLDDHQLPTYLERFMTEERVSELQSTINEIVGLHPSMWELHEKMGDTIVRLLTHGNVVIVGRGGCIVGKGLRNVLNVRLVGSTQRRSAHLQRLFDLSPKDADKRIERDDKNRAEYFQARFGRNIEDPELYHLVINTDDLSDAEVARLIGEAATRHTREKYQVA